MTNVAWRKFGEYSGCKIDGVAAVPKPDVLLHMERAYYLTALIEAPTYGAVQSYDGAAMSGGPLHNIAVYPKGMTQGSLFQLLRAIEVGASRSDALRQLWAAYAQLGWVVTQDGLLRNAKSGQPVDGTVIRNAFTPLDGKVPQSGPQWDTASRWALAHHQVFADPATYAAQKDFAIGWLLSTQRALESTFYQGADPKLVSVGDKGLSMAEDLAMSVYHCYSVNGPAPARDDLIAALKVSTRGPAFAKALIQHLAATAFGNWENRYTRTRNAAMNSGLWPKELFAGAGALFPAK